VYHVFMTKHRYLVVVTPSLEVDTWLRASYLDAAGSELPIKRLHCSLVYPFYLGGDLTEEQLARHLKAFHFTPFLARLGELKLVDYQEKKLLWIALEPKEEWRALHDALGSHLSGRIRLDETLFPDGQFPPFDAHFSLNYNWQGDFESFRSRLESAEPAKTASDQVFYVNSVQLQREDAPGNWVEV
jgi:hypothetical protein